MARMLFVILCRLLEEFVIHIIITESISVTTMSTTNIANLLRVHLTSVISVPRWVRRLPMMPQCLSPWPIHVPMDAMPMASLSCEQTTKARQSTNLIISWRYYKKFLDSLMISYSNLFDAVWHLFCANDCCNFFFPRLLLQTTTSINIHVQNMESNLVSKWEKRISVKAAHPCLTPEEQFYIQGLFGVRHQNKE